MSHHELRPAVGIEEESRGSINGVPFRTDVSSQILKEMIREAGGGHGPFTKNGSRYYYDGAPEFATPECKGPEQVNTYVHANEANFRAAVATVSTTTAERSGTDVHARVHRRVIDDTGNTHGKHLNISISAELAEALRYKTDHRLLLLGGSATRTVVTGAGLVHQDGTLYYSQKQSVEYKNLQGGGPYPRVFDVRSARNAGSKEYERRLELKGGDINFSDWAVQVEVASTVGGLAIARTPLIEHFPDREIGGWVRPSPGNEMNILRLNPDGTIAPTPAVRTAVDVQQRVAEVMLEEFEQYGPRLDSEYRMLYEELKQFGIDFKKVLAGDATIDLLADRADWAAKCAFILEKLRTRPAWRLGGVESQGLDMAYDMYDVRVHNGKAKIGLGQGYRLRRDGKFRLGADSAAITAARTAPPKDSRAEDRVECMTDSNIYEIEWPHARFANGSFRSFRRLASV